MGMRTKDEYTPRQRAESLEAVATGYDSGRTAEHDALHLLLTEVARVVRDVAVTKDLSVSGLVDRLKVIEDARAKSSTLNITGLVNRIRELEKWAETVDGRLEALEAAAPKPNPKPVDCPWCESEAWQQGGGSEEGMGPAYWVVCSEDLCDACGPLRPSAQEATAAWNKVAAK